MCNVTYSYDADGNELGHSGGRAYGYNAENQTTSAQAPGKTALALGYTGDGQTQRVQAGGASFRHSLLGLSSAVASCGPTNGPPP